MLAKGRDFAAGDVDWGGLDSCDRRCPIAIVPSLPVFGNRQRVEDAKGEQRSLWFGDGKAIALFPFNMVL
ncbi:MAG: hypothetical protein J7647_16565 [Cyanobacteria bacterium SBLK]|nr:hypothetical protein [Cyanobacteria bacterium SBLK]